MTGKRTIHKTSKVKTFLFFLLLATIFWVLTKFSKDSSATVQANLEYVNVPSGVSISEKNIDKISFEVSGNGFEMLSYKLKSPTIAIDLANYYEKGDSVLLFSSGELTNLINTQLESKNKISSISREELWLSLDALVSKRVAVKLVTDIAYKEGYNAIEPLLITPDSVLISGPSKVISSIEVVETNVYANNTIAEDISEEITIAIPENVAIDIQPTTVQLTAQVSEFSQKQLSIPIEVLNVPNEIKVRLLPEVAMVSFNVSVHQFNSITASDFKVTCDFSQKVADQPYLPLKITGRPKDIHHVELLTKQIEFLIFN